MIHFIKDFFYKFINGSWQRKIITILLCFIYIASLVLLFVKVDYVVITPGLINNTAQTTDENKGNVSLTISTDYASGNIFTIGVYTHYNVSLFQYLIANMSNNISVSSFDTSTDLSAAEEYQRGVIQKENSITSAIICAYEAAKLKDPTITITKELLGMRVSAVTKDSQSNLQIGDLIIKINDVVINDYSHFLELRDQVNGTDNFSLFIKRNGEEKTITAKMIPVIDANNETVYRLGIEALAEYKLTDVFPNYELADKLDSIGGSGGAMLALSIYNSLLEEDFTMGKTIVGTGTIDADGIIGDIGGVSQKIVTARLYQVDYFFVNPEDYDEANEKYQELNPDFQLVEVSNFLELIAFLEGEQNE